MGPAPPAPATSSGGAVLKGPARPTPEMLAAAADALVATEEKSDEEAGPLPMGAEGEDVYADRRQDLDNLETGEPTREEWMLTPGERLKFAFGGPKEAIGDKFAVKRSKEEEEAFERAFNARGVPLMQQVQSGQFNSEDMKAAVAKYDMASASNDLWGLSARDQMAAGAAKTGRRPFDPERDMDIKKSMSGASFQNMVAEAKGMSDRFKRSGVATSFL
eukprot:GEMP01066224.1.p1 GENE.GEMP01066224.1~~GEMP01066224.1.p1  ORF type:complete len:218 (+),score=54.50 GEMP01066224.1:450-1103(+)